MLVLSRKAMEGITINQQIKIVVIEIHGKRVRLGIEAPKDFGVQRFPVGNARSAGELVAVAGEGQTERQ